MKTWAQVQAEWETQVKVRAVELVEQQGFSPEEAMDMAENLVRQVRQDRREQRKKLNIAKDQITLIVTDVRKMYEITGSREYVSGYDVDTGERVAWLRVKDKVEIGDTLRITVEKLSK